MNKVSVSWSAKRNGNEGTVYEVRSDGTNSTFGPMPAHVVPAFVRGRQIIVAHLLRSSGFDPTITEEELEPEFQKYFSNPA